MEKIKRLIIPMFCSFVAVALFFFLSNSITGRFAQGIVIAKVTRVVDGDTIVINNKTRVRLIGINAPELFVKGRKSFRERCSLKAKEFLKKLIENKKVKVEIEGKDKYGRFLASIWFKGLFVNELLVKNGYAHAFFIRKSPYEKIFYLDELRSYRDGGCVWQKSNYFGCIKLVKFSPSGKEFLVFKNVCNISINLKDWYLRDEDHHFLFFPFYELPANGEIKICSGFLDNSCNFSFKEGNVWNDENDSIFLRDSKGLLVFFYHY